MQYLKRASAPPSQQDDQVAAVVAEILSKVAEEGEAAVRRYNSLFDGWDGAISLDRDALDKAATRLPDSVRDDLTFAYQQVRNFAQHQRDAIREFEVENRPGVTVGQRLIPVQTAGCYVPGGRYAHAASAIMSVATAQVAGVQRIITSTPAHAGVGPHPAILFALTLSGATDVLLAGGVQGIAALAYGVTTGQPADVVVGPGNRYVAEAKRQLVGQVGIDVIAGPTENLIIADDSADPHIVAADLAGQAEHGSDSPVWLITTSQAVGEAVNELVPQLIATLPEPAKTQAASAWRDYGEIVVAADREEAAQLSDQYASEHLQVQAEDPDWWLARLQNYGSLFLGEETTVAYGDKCTGPNHILPTRGGSRYSGGLSVAKFIKVVTYQRLTREGSATIGQRSSRISRLEGMEGHARSADVRLAKYFPDQRFDLHPSSIDWPLDEKTE